MSDTPTYYKWLHADGSAPYSFWQWSRPTDDTPGPWTPFVETLIECRQGYHLCLNAVDSLLEYVGGGTLPRVLWEAEPRPGVKSEHYGDKFNVQSARLVKRVGTLTDENARLFAVDCAERVLPLFERRYPSDTRPREALAAARCYARKEAERVDADSIMPTDGTPLWRAVQADVWYAARATCARNALSVADNASYNSAHAVGSAAVNKLMRPEDKDKAIKAASTTERVWQLQRLLAYVRGEVA